MNPDSIDWDEDLPPASPEEEYQALRRAIQRTDGFGLLFVQCAPAKGHEIIEQIKEDLPQKKVEVFSLKEPIRNLYERVEALPNRNEIDVLFIEGLEYSIYEYEDVKRHLGWTTEEIQSYSWKSVPHVLTNLNQQRERFRDNFQVCFVFLVPLFVLKYLIYRAPDFFDWRAGTFHFRMDIDQIQENISYIYISKSHEEYDQLTSQDRTQKILHIQNLIEEAQDNSLDLANLYCELSELFSADQHWQAVIASCNQALKFKSDKYQIWINRGNALAQLNQLEDALISFDKAIEINSEGCSENWTNRGIVLYKLGRDKEAISSFDRAIDITDRDYQAWIYRGLSFGHLGFHKDALDNFAQATKFDSHYRAWFYKGIALNYLRRYKQAIVDFDKAIEIDSNKDFIWFRRGIALRGLKRYNEALTSLDKAVSLNPDEFKLWNYRGILLRKLYRYEDAVESYDKALSINPNYYIAWYNRGNSLRKLYRYEDAVESYDKALSINPNYYIAWYNKGKALYKLGLYRKMLESYKIAVVYDFKFLALRLQKWLHKSQKWLHKS